MVGMLLLAAGGDFATLYVGLETMALASYALVGYTRASPKSNEAALKYFLLGAFASGVLLFGISLVFGATGSFHLAGIEAALRDSQTAASPLLGIGAVLIVVGLAFKVAAVPFHMWTPDAYEGAPAPVAGFLSTAAKTAAFALLLRVLVVGFLPVAESWIPMLALLATASMVVGNVTALRQDNVKRMLAYSSIAHAGYVLMGIVTIASGRWDPDLRRHGLTAAILYLLVYTFTNLGAFGLVALLRREGQAGDTIADFRGLRHRSPLAAAAMVVFLLSLAGIPCTAGFIGKWWLFGAAIRADFAWLAVVAVVNSAVSLYYYARIAVAMYMTPPEDDRRLAVPFATGAAIAIAAALTLVIGIYPQPFIVLAQLARVSGGAP
jgi:NADH-quinone oxidoreductase subunit N